MWLGEKITDKGIGNGVSLLITIGIIATLPREFFGEMSKRITGGSLFILILELALFFVVVMAVVLVVQGVRRIPIQFAKRMVGRSNANMPQAGARDYIPLKVNASGVMPIIFAQAIMFLPPQLGQWLTKDGEVPGGMMMAFSDWLSLPYNILFFILVVVFTYVYTALLVNPQQYSEYLQRQSLVYRYSFQPLRGSRYPTAPKSCPCLRPCRL